MARFDSGAPITLGLEEKSAADFAFDPTVANFYRKGFPGMFSALSGGMPSWSGESVTLQAVLSDSVCWACYKLVSETVGALPAVMMQQKGNQKREATEHPMYNAMKLAPNDEITAQGFSEMLTGHRLMMGNGYAKITRRSGTGVAISLDPLSPECVYPDREKTGQKRLVYVIKNQGEPDKSFTVEHGKPHDILHLRGLSWNGVLGQMAVVLGRNSIGSAIAAERNVARFWAHGGRTPFHVEMPNKFATKESYDRFRADLEAILAEPHRIPIFDNGTTWKDHGLSMVEAQASEIRQFNVTERCRWFGVNPYLVGDLSRATNNNIEQLALDLVKLTLAPHIGCWEQQFWLNVLTDQEKADGYFLRHNLNALLRGDFKTRMEGYASALQNGHMVIDEVRELEDRNQFPDGIGSHPHIQINQGTLPGDTAPPPVALVPLSGKKPAA